VTIVGNNKDYNSPFCSFLLLAIDAELLSTSDLLLKGSSKVLIAGI
jgi:hypothetical protein